MPKVNNRDAVLAHLEKHGATSAKDVALALNVHKTTVSKILGTAYKAGEVTREIKKRILYYSLNVSADKAIADKIDQGAVDAINKAKDERVNAVADQLEAGAAKPSPKPMTAALQDIIDEVDNPTRKTGSPRSNRKDKRPKVVDIQKESANLYGKPQSIGAKTLPEVKGVPPGIAAPPAINMNIAGEYRVSPPNDLILEDGSVDWEKLTPYRRGDVIMYEGRGETKGLGLQYAIVIYVDWFYWKGKGYLRVATSRGARAWKSLSLIVGKVDNGKVSQWKVDNPRAVKAFEAAKVPEFLKWKRELNLAHKKMRQDAATYAK